MNQTTSETLHNAGEMALIWRREGEPANVLQELSVNRRIAANYRGHRSVILSRPEGWYCVP